MSVKTLLQAKVINKYRSQKPAGFYSEKKGHTGVDLDFKTGDIFLAPISGKNLKVAMQREMGKCIYVLHEATGDIWVFAHLEKALLGENDRVGRRDKLAITGNTGEKSTRPHLHAEVITKLPVVDPAEGGQKENVFMTRKLWNFEGFNCDPIKRLKAVYKKYGVVDGVTNEVPHNPHGF